MELGRRLAKIFLFIFVCSSLSAALLPGFLRDFSWGSTVEITDIRPFEGLAYRATLVDSSTGNDATPAFTRLYVHQTRRGTFSHHLDPWCADSYLFGWLSALLDVNFPFANYTTRKEVGPGNSPLESIVTEGNGRYTVRPGELYLSLPPGALLTSVQRLELVFPVVDASAQQKVEGLTARLRFLPDVLALSLAAFVAVWIGLNLLGSIGGSLKPGLLITAVLFLLISSGAEFYFRANDRFPKGQSNFPYVFVENVGLLYQAGQVLKWTNGVDFWASNAINSLGFPDKEPVLPKPQGVRRVLIVGDSFVEAAQVSLEKKVQRLLDADLAREFSSRQTDVVAMGFSGTGQAGQLPFYERSRAVLRPNLVILIFVSNDFANNSALLEAVRHGWHPDHSPRLSISEVCNRVEMSADWQKHLLRGSTYRDRLKTLRELSPTYAAKLEGYNPPGEEGFFDFDSDLAEMMPRVFEDAISSTKCAIAAWKSLAEQDGFKLVVVANGDVTSRPARLGGIERLKKITRDLDIPLIDLHPEFQKHERPESVRWPHDSHWTPAGHRWAADAILEYIRKTPESLFEK